MADRLPDALSFDSLGATVRERASAMPDRNAKGRSHSLSGSAAAPLPLPLNQLQRWFVDALTAGPGLDDAVANANANLSLSGEIPLRAILTPGPRLSATERLELYFDGYSARLIECLESDYPVLAYALGPELWSQLCRDYIARHPSRSPNLNGFGERLPAFVREWSAAPQEFFADLARLEWALVETVHAPEGGAIGADMLAQIPEGSWDDARFVKSPKARILHFRTPANAYFQAFYRDEEPKIPEPKETATAVYRRDFVVWRMDLTPAMTGVLEALFRGDTLGAALSSMEKYAESPEAESEAERSVMVWFQAWMQAGFFESVGLF